MASEPTRGAAPLAHVVTGPLGAGKTTLLARQFAAKPPDEHWVVLLNEFTLAGIDALTVAASARGSYDVRLVEGGCLCCTGEQDFRRNLLELVDQIRPAQIWVEPSGLGHPSGVVEELLMHARRGALRMGRVVALVDPERLDEAIRAPRSPLREQLGIADAVALSKAETATLPQREAFMQWARSLFPGKSWAGPMAGGLLPAAALQAAPLQSRDSAGATVGHLDGHRSMHWVFPREVEFDADRLTWCLTAGIAAWPEAFRPLRTKGVFRVGEDRWILAQRVGSRLEVTPSSWRHDSRVEVIWPTEVMPDLEQWRALWTRAQAPASVV